MTLEQHLTRIVAANAGEVNPDQCAADRAAVYRLAPGSRELADELMTSADSERLAAVAKQKILALPRQSVG